MNKIALVILVIGCAIFAGFSPGEEEQFPTIELGAVMPMMDLEMRNIDNNMMSLSDIKQKNGTLVIFSCNTCPFVTQWEDRYDDVTAIAGRYGFGTALINSNEAKRTGDDSFENMVSHAKEVMYKSPYLVDKNSLIANAFGAKTTPHVFLFDSDDLLVYAGAIDDNSKDADAVSESYLINALNQIGIGRTIKVNQTPAKGCSIKRVK